jgi:hypothetical protein
VGSFLILGSIARASANYFLKKRNVLQVAGQAWLQRHSVQLQAQLGLPCVE